MIVDLCMCRNDEIKDYVFNTDFFREEMSAFFQEGLSIINVFLKYSSATTSSHCKIKPKEKAFTDVFCYLVLSALSGYIVSTYSIFDFYEDNFTV